MAETATEYDYKLAYVTRADEHHAVMASSDGKYVFLANMDVHKLVATLIPDAAGVKITAQVPEYPFALEPSGSMYTVTMDRYIVNGVVFYLGWDAPGQRWWIHKQEIWERPGEKP